MTKMAKQRRDGADKTREKAGRRACCRETGRTAPLTDGGEVRIRTLGELRTGPTMLIRDVYFEGGDVLHCHEGCFRFEFGDREPIEIRSGETLVIYPDQRVSIRAMDRENGLRYAILDGPGVADYFDGFGFHDGIHGRTSGQSEVFEWMFRQLEDEPQDLSALASRMADALTSYAHDLRDSGDILIADAVRHIRANLRQGKVRIEPLCLQLGVSRSHLHDVFLKAGLGGASEFIKREQLRLALRLLRQPQLPVKEVAARTGFLTAAHFSTFVKRRTGRSPHELRRA